MVISDFAIKRPMITVVTMVALVVFGLFALWRLQTDEFPDIQQPVVLTFIPYPGASPEGVEREVLKPVEDAIKGISGGRSPRMPEIASRTSWEACWTSFSKSKKMVNSAVQSIDALVVSSPSSPLMAKIASSTGSTISRSTTSGEAPG